MKEALERKKEELGLLGEAFQNKVLIYSYWVKIPNQIF